MKSQHIIVTVLVLSLSQWSISSPATEQPKADAIPAEAAAATPAPLDEGKNTTTVGPITTPPSTTSSTTPPTTPSTAPPTPPPTTSTTTTTTPTPTTTPSTTTPASTTTTTTAAPPAPTPCRHFDAPSFIGGIVLTIGLIAIGFVAHRIYKAKFDSNYHTL